MNRFVVTSLFVFAFSFLLFGCLDTGQKLAASGPGAQKVSTESPGVASILPGESARAASTFSVSSPSSTTVVASDVSMKTYQGDEFQINYPASWAVLENQGAVLFQSPAENEQDALQENVNVVIAKTTQTLQSFVEQAIGPSMELPGFDLKESTETTLSGISSRKIVYAEQSADGAFQYEQIIAVNEGRAYIVTYTATPQTFSKYAAQADAMAASFKVKIGSETNPTPAPIESSTNPELVHKWRVYSEAIYYDAGGWNFLDTPATTHLDLRADQTWSFGSSQGTWSVQPIAESDWQKWGVSSYGPKNKLVLNGWNGDRGDGPIDQSETRADFVWMIYRVGPPTVKSPAQIQMKFGWTNQ